MMRRIEMVVRAVVLPLLVSLLCHRVALAQQDRYLPLVTQLPTDARAHALGSAGIAVDGADAVFRNPALVGSAAPMSLSLARFSASAAGGALASSTRVGSVGIGIGVQYVSFARQPESDPVSSQALTSGGPNPAASLSATVAASQVWKGVKFGAGVKVVQQQDATRRAGGVAFDLGVAKELPYFTRLAVAAAVQSLGPSLTFAGQHYALPARGVIGVQGGTYSLSRWVDAAFVAQLAVRRDGVMVPAVGGELTYAPLEGIAVSGRAGLRRTELHVQQPFSAGAGVSVDHVTVDYSWESLRGGGSAHRISIVVR